MTANVLFVDMEKYVAGNRMRPSVNGSADLLVD